MLIGNGYLNGNKKKKGGGGGDKAEHDDRSHGVSVNKARQLHATNASCITKM